MAVGAFVPTTALPRTRRRSHAPTKCAPRSAGSSPSTQPSNAKPTTPPWAGGGPVTSLVNAVISFEPLYKIIRTQAKQTLIRTAEQNGVPWMQMLEDLDQSPAREYFDGVRNPDIDYPSYYTLPFHGYPEGNLCWKAAFEAEAATQAVAIRTKVGDAGMSGEQAVKKIRDLLHEKVLEHAGEQLRQATDVLDVACSVGVSTRLLREYLSEIREADQPPVRMTGLDLSPHMLSVAKYRSALNGDDIEWVHALGEAMPFPDNSFDVVAVSYLIHELPGAATAAVVRECARVVRPGGTVFLTDNDPKSETLRKLPAPIFTMMKSTEPHSDEYFPLCMDTVLRQAGLEVLFHGPCDNRHRAIVTRKP